jgi:hypothetical protein
MKEIDSEDTYFKEIMSNSRLDVPFLDFDNKVMGLIEKRLSKKVSITRDIKLSWLFFILGSIFGIIVSIMLPKLQDSMIGIPIEKITIIFLIVFSYIIMTQLDNFIDFYKRKRINNKMLKMS